MPDPTTLYSVGAAPHVRPRKSLTSMHHWTVLALLPVTLLGAIGHAFGTRATALDPADAGIGSLDGLVSSLTVAMGVDSGSLWFLGILGMVALASGFADNLIVEAFKEVEVNPKGKDAGKAPAKTRRVSLGILPAVPFVVVEP